MTSFFPGGLWKKDATLSVDFRQELTALNLRRAVWLIAAGIVFTIIGIVFTRLNPEPWTIKVQWVLWIDLASAFLVLALNYKIQALPHDSRVRPTFVLTLAVAFLAFMDAYYFVIFPVAGQNPNYLLGVIITSALFLFRPAIFLPLLLGNHALYGLILFLIARDHSRLPLILLENTTGVGVAALTAYLLFRSRRDEFTQRQTLRGINSQLEKRNSQLHDLMAITAHDLRSPLLGLRDLLSLARRDSLPSEAKEKVLTQAGQSCGQMLSLVGGLLDAHAAEQMTETPLSLDSGDIREELDAAIARAALHFSALGIPIQKEFSENTAELSFHREALAQVLDNLLANALRFAPPGTTVKVSLDRDREGWHCDIIDQGSGVASSDQARLFQKFYRGTNQPEQVEAGHGLGLFIVASLMAAMRGRVEYVADAPETTFRLRFAS